MAKNQQAASQQLLFPISITLNPADHYLVTEMEQEITNLGFTFSQIGGNSLMINGIPADILDERAQEIFESLLEQFKQNKAEITIDKKENLARSLAKRMASRQTVVLQTTEIHALVDQLFGSSNPQFTPFGEPIMKIITLDKLGSMLKS